MFVFLIPVVLGIGLLSAGPLDSVLASTEAVFQNTPAPINTVPMDNDDCLECHGQKDMFLPLASGEQVDLHVDRILFRSSVHGRLGYACVQCHTDITDFPHAEVNFENARQLTIEMSKACGSCHEAELDQYTEGYHSEYLNSEEPGAENAAVCADCHGAHSTEQFSASRTAIPKACQQCHSDIYDVYADSVHGDALFDEFNADVPTCVDCHGHHGNQGPAVEGFHLFSPQVCLKCHEDERLMDKYEINTEVSETYFADFHGTTVSIFERVAPDQETNKPVCIDCHGVHNIKSPDNVESTVFKQNLLGTCQRCHGDATKNFNASWLNHYTPDPENYTIVYIVDLFYKFFIPGTLGLMAVFVITDFWRSKIKKSH